MPKVPEKWHIMISRDLRMKKFLSVSMLVALCTVGFAQSPITLGEAKPIDIHVADVEWQPKGQAMIYRRQEQDGSSIGI